MGALGFIAASPATATVTGESRDGYLECQSGRTVRITSTTIKTQTYHYVEYDIGSKTTSYSTAGTHTWNSGSPGGSWQIYTNGTISSYNVYCA